MDMAFLPRAERLLAQETPARLDHALLLASLVARRTGEPARAPSDEAVEEPMIEMLVSGGAWRRAIAAQRGCFNRAEAGRRRNAP